MKIAGGDDSGSPDDVSALSERAHDQDRLLPGENVLTPYAEDSVHWAKVYGELLRYKDQILGVLESQIRTASEAARADLNDIDVELMQAQRRRYERRLQFWRERVKELAGRRQGDRGNG
jgi:hypothetical protein